MFDVGQVLEGVAVVTGEASAIVVSIVHPKEE
jgi:hypothetical protein